MSVLAKAMRSLPNGQKNETHSAIKALLGVIL